MSKKSRGRDDWIRSMLWTVFDRFIFSRKNICISGVLLDPGNGKPTAFLLSDPCDEGSAIVMRSGPLPDG